MSELTQIISNEKPSILRIDVTSAGCSIIIKTKLKQYSNDFKLSLRLLCIIPKEKKNTSYFPLSSVIFIRIAFGSLDKNETFLQTLYSYISSIEKTEIDIPSSLCQIESNSDKVMVLLPIKITTLPFLPFQSRNYPFPSIILTSLLPITQQIQTFIQPSDFPLISWIIDSQNPEKNPSFSKLFTLLPKLSAAQFSDFSIDSLRTSIRAFVEQFCEENSFLLAVSEVFPCSKVVIEEDADVILFLPSMGEEQFIKKVILRNASTFYHVVSVISETNGHFSTQLTTHFGNYEVYEQNISQILTLLHTSPSTGRRVLSLLYVRMNVYEYFDRFPYWPHPIVENPIEKNIPILPTNDISEKHFEKKFYFNFNTKYMKYPCIPLPYAKSKEALWTFPRKRGQIIWRVTEDNEQIPFYLEGTKKRVSEIIKFVLEQNNEKDKQETNFALIQSYNNNAICIFKPEEEISFPIESLLVLDIIKPPEDVPYQDSLVCVSYAKILDNIPPYPLKYFHHPRVFQKIANIAKTSRLQSKQTTKQTNYGLEGLTFDEKIIQNNRNLILLIYHKIPKKKTSN